MSLSLNFGALSPSLLLDFSNTKQLDPRITFTRASTATFYNGVTTTVAEQNLFTNSQEINSWTPSGVTVGTNTDTAPDGTTTAEAIKEDSTTATHRVQQPNGIPLLNATTYTMSVFVKQKTGSRFATIGFSADGTNFASATFNLATGALTQNLTSGFTSASATITASVNNWYRVTLTATTNVSSAAALMFLGLSATSTFTSASRGFDSYAGDNTSEILYWGAQFEQRSSATAYTATTTQPITNYIPVLQTAQNNVPRFEHNPVTGESLGLEIEEQRTNLLTYSEQFDNAAWTKVASTITANTIVAPDGLLSGDLIVANTTNAQHRIDLIPASSAGSQVFSVYAKSGGYNFIGLRIGSSGTSFNLSTGAVSINGSGSVGSIQSVGNGWYRCSIVVAAALANDTVRINITDATSASTSFAGDGYSGIFIWGAQLEAGAFPTSYIKTEASQVTRSADNASMTGTNFSSWFNNSEGTLYGEYAIPFDSSSSIFPIVAALSDNTYNNSIVLYERTIDDTRRATVRVGGVSQYDASNGGTYTYGTATKQSFAYKVNDLSLSVNGATPNTLATSLIPVVNRLGIGTNDVLGGSLTILNGTIRKLAYYPARLSNTQIVALTTV